MPTLTIRRGPQAFAVDFEGGQPLSALLEKAGQELARPCGGRGSCGKCAVALTGDVSAPNGAEMRCGTRLACQAVVLGDAEVILPDVLPLEQIEGGSGRVLPIGRVMPGRYGAAADIGTTTLALRLVDLQSGECLAGSGMLNPQTGTAADVIGRMAASMQGQAEKLRRDVTEAVDTLLHRACAEAGIPAERVESLTLTGNTTMLYLLTGRNPESLSHAPFAADHLFGEEGELLGRRAYLPRCLHAFVGADTACALLASGMLDRDETALLCDIGTNGEMALRHQGRLYITSTAAGPAFEGAGIRMGCASVPGAIDRVTAENGDITVHTIGGKRAVGICGSGLVDAAAALLDTGMLDETGALEEDPVPLKDGVCLYQQDIRALQLAKAAISAGTHCLLRAAGCREEQVAAVYLAGGFGSHLRMESAQRIGLFPPCLAEKTQVIGNAALDGAAMLLADTALREDLMRLSGAAQHVSLDGNPLFSQRYVEDMLFGGDDW